MVNSLFSPTDLHSDLSYFVATDFSGTHFFPKSGSNSDFYIPFTRVIQMTGIFSRKYGSVWTFLMISYGRSRFEVKLINLTQSLQI